MDPRLQQELEQNDLANFIAGFSTWWGKHGTKVLAVILLLALTILIKRWYDRRQEETLENMWGMSGLAGTTVPRSLMELAEQYDDPTFRALAYLKAGNLQLKAAIIPPAPPRATTQPAASQPEPLTPAKCKELLNEAAGAFQKVLNLTPASAMLRYNASLGLAAVYETQGQWDQAGALYTTLQKDAAPRYQAIAEQAAYLLKTLATRRTAVVFAAKPLTLPTMPTMPTTPTTPPTSQPPLLLPGVN